MATLTSQIEALITFANETTGKGDTRLGDAVKRLADGYKGGRLPKEFQEVEWIELDGAQYIDTEINVTSNLRWECRAMSKKRSVANYCGCGQGADDTRFWFGHSSSNGQIIGFGGARQIYGNPFTMTTYIIHNGKGYGYDNVFSSYKETIRPADTICIGRRSASQYFRVSWSKIYDDNSNLIQYLIPCYRKSDKVSGMYDLVNDYFYTNQGTGEFIVGPDVVEETPQFPTIDDSDTLSSKLIALIAYANSITHKADATIGDAVRSLVEGYGGVKGYTFHSFLQSDGNAYIDTNFLVKRRDYKFVIDYQLRDYQTIDVLLSTTATGNDGLRLVFSSNAIYHNYCDKNRIQTNNTSLYLYNKNRNVVEYSVDGIYKNGVKIVSTTNGTYWTDSTLKIFHEHFYNYSTKAYLYGFKILQNSTVIMNLIPASRDSDGVCGMYDLVTDTFLTNANTEGKFTVGD